MVTVVRRSVASALIALTAVVFAGCSGDIPVDVSEADVIGVWRSADLDVPIVITVDLDGTYEMTNWPSRVNCVQPYAQSIKDLETDVRSDVSYRWYYLTGDLPSAFGFYVPKDCATQPMPKFFRGDDGALLMKFYLFNDVDPDLAGPDDMLTFRKDYLAVQELAGDS